MLSLSRLLTCSLLLLVPVLATAATSETTSVQATKTTSVGDERPTQDALKQDEAIASSWGLTIDEYKQYQTIMQGPRGIWSPEADPIMILGVESKSEQEQRRYARLYLKMQGQREMREINFTALLMEEQEKLMQVRPAPAFQSSSNNTVVNQIPARYVFFSSIKDSCATCKQKLATAINLAIKNNVVLDIYLLDSEQQDVAVRDWAKAMGVPVAYVKEGKVTLNHDSGAFSKLTQQTTATWPVAFSKSLTGGYTRL